MHPKDVIEHFIPSITFSFITKQGVAVKRVQFPTRVCFAITIHKSRGRTLLDKVVFDNRLDVFMHGYLYVVALSRVRAAKDIRILVDLLPDWPDKIFARVSNVVYKPLLYRRHNNYARTWYYAACRGSMSTRRACKLRNKYYLKKNGCTHTITKEKHCIMYLYNLSSHTITTAETLLPYTTHTCRQ